MTPKQKTVLAVIASFGAANFKLVAQQVAVAKVAESARPAPRGLRRVLNALIAQGAVVEAKGEYLPAPSAADRAYEAGYEAGYKAGLAAAMAHKTVKAAAPAPAEEADIAGEIKAAYQALATRPRDWVNLRDLRPRLSGDKAAQDAAMLAMYNAKTADFTLEEAQWELTKADHDAALRLGPNNMHKIEMRAW